uniref:Uncharacterized protein n=1 Tax=Kryptolebias marmoratus TaxID=37003 RepID=A0A3Q2ZTC8_KRYMA
IYSQPAGAFVGVLDDEAAAQHLNKHLPELPGGHVVQERVENGAEVEEGVAHKVERGDSPQVGRRPVGLGDGGHHETKDLVGEPAHHQRSNDETWKKSRKYASFQLNVWASYLPNSS